MRVGKMTSADLLFKGSFEIMKRVTGGYNIAHRGINTSVNITPVPPGQACTLEESGSCRYKFCKVKKKHNEQLFVNNVSQFSCK